MSAEALARVLWGNGNPATDIDGSYAEQAERILADPAPLLAALAEAGVLREECSAKFGLSRYTTDWTEAPR